MDLALDVDAVCKLGHWRLLDDLEVILRIPKARTATLSSLKFRAARASISADGKLFKSEAAAERIRVYAESLCPPPESNAAFLEEIQDIPGVDSGEAVLIGVIAQHPTSLLVTGDKRALNGLASGLSAATLALIRGRIIVVEQVLLALLQKNGVEWMRERICSCRGVDKAVDIVMGSTCSASFDAVAEGLQSYIGDLRSQTGQLMHPGIHEK